MGKKDVVGAYFHTSMLRGSRVDRMNQLLNNG